MAKTYTVVSGDTLSKIARDFGTNVDEIAKLNNIANVNLINVGQVLQIPEAPKGDGAYTIVAGDTLTGIAKKYETTVEYLVELNSIRDPNMIYAGATIKVPTAGSTSSLSEKESNEISDEVRVAAAKAKAQAAIAKAKAEKEAAESVEKDDEKKTLLEKLKDLIAK